MRKALPPPGAAVLLYGRFSSDLQNPKSAEDQHAEGELFAARNGWTVAGKYADHGETGRSVVNRPGLLQMLDDAITNERQAIIVEDISRLGRNAADLHIIANRLKEAQVLIITFTSGVMSGLDLAIRASMAEEQSLEHGHRVKRGHRASAKRGRVMGGVAYGYRLAEAASEIDGTVDGPRRRNSDGGKEQMRAVDPIQKVTVERIYRDFNAGMSTNQICKALNQECVPAPGGGLWYPRRLTGDKHLLNGVLRNPIYTGRVQYGKSVTTFRSSSGTNKVTPGLAADQIHEQVEALRIVSDEVWADAQARLAANSCTVPNQARYADYLLSRKVRCGSCGQPYSVVGEGMGCMSRRVGAPCENRRRVKRQDLEHTVLSGLKDRLLQPHILNLYLDEYRAEWGRMVLELEERAKVTAARLQDVRTRLGNLYELAETATGAARAGLSDRINTLDAEAQQLERLVRSQHKAATPSVEAADVIEKIGGLIDDMGAVVNGPERDAARLKETLRAMIDEVVVSPVPDLGKPDGRGSGPVSIKVTGSLTAMVDYCEGRVIHRRGTNPATVDDATVQYTIYVGWSPQRGAEFEVDVALWTAMLNDADVPLTLAVLTDALEHLDAGSGDDAFKARDRRARRVLEYFKGKSLVGCVHWSEGVGRTAGWVWSSQLDNAGLWRERAKAPPLAAIAVMRLAAPEAFGTVVGKKRAISNGP
ncbi:recombinase family protein [Brevundimonas sp. TSRC1-1]|uniref:recombinase family protein n=1 Tax=Brevundimonas sp. TSRC1-1 TaxID=2804562 RepID=UPI003CF6E7C5